MDTAQWPQPTKEMERRNRSEEALNKYCPRCNSKHTKFCYYNNYSLSQPRYFCKTCRRYSTHCGSLRTILVGGASRNNKTTTRTSQRTNLLSLLHLPLKLKVSKSWLLLKGSHQVSLPHLLFTTFASASSPSGLCLRYKLIKPVFDFSLDGGNPLNQEEVSNAATNTSDRLLLPFEILKPPSLPPSSNSGVEYNHRKRTSDDLTHDKQEEADRSALGFGVICLVVNHGNYKSKEVKV